MSLKICKAPRDIIVRVIGRKLQLPTDINEAITRNNLALRENGLDFDDDTVFARLRVDWKDGGLCCQVCPTSYGHYLLSKKFNHRSDELSVPVHVVHTATFLITTDGYALVGKMDASTSNAGGIQAIGGTLDMQDVRSDNTLDLENNVYREVREEVGIDVTDTSHVSDVRRSCVVHGGEEGKIAIVYVAQLVMDVSQFEKHFSDYQRGLQDRGTPCEFVQIYPVALSSDSVGEFVQEYRSLMTHYVALVLQQLVE